MGAVTRIEEIKFPTTLKPGIPITGELILMNVGDEPTGAEAGIFTVVITTLWDGKEYMVVEYSATYPGETVTVLFHHGNPAGVMPGADAQLKIEGGMWLGYNGGLRIDDTKSWIITSGEAPPPPEPVPILPIIGSLLTGVVLVVLCLIKPGR